MPLSIRHFEARDQIAARQLILTGLGEHFGWIDETCNPDLDDITANYLACGHTFLIAEIDGELVGTGALMTESEKVGRIVRMSVSHNHRRNRIGQALVARLLEIAKQKRFSEIKISTDVGWDDAIGLYNHCGFTETHRDQLGVYFELHLDNHPCHFERSEKS